ncbi:BamA/TamA family outer membrane protein [Algoriphagus sp. SE2]|uniref:BamA/TamA family outer membrane protein n=1 Tax=Algoriphagus sp. SE2 TaxID=3141536 RepID=UPI0031CD18FD
MRKGNGIKETLERIGYSIPKLKKYFFIACLTFQALFLGPVSNSVARQLFKKDSTKAEVKPNKLYLIPLPALSYNPAFGFIYGVAASSNILIGDSKDTKLSSGFLNATYSSKKQLILSLKTTIYSNHNNWILLGDWRFLDSSQPTYGLGTGIQSEILVTEMQDGFELGDYKDGVDLAELMEFNLIRFHQIALKRIKNSLYAGLGYHLDRYSNIQDNLLDLESDPPRITNHFAYNTLHEFDLEEYTISGPSLNAILDTRDNVNFPFKGRYAFLQYRFLPGWLGSEKSTHSWWLEYRQYWNVSQKVERNTIAFWAFANITPFGKLPYMGLPALGWDQLGRSGRAYPQGRFRGENLFYSEVEYRFRIPLLNKNPDFLGGVVFANTTSASSLDQDLKLFQTVKGGAGVGLRFMFQKATRSNVTLDYGIGADGKGAIYFNLNEYF